MLGQVVERARAMAVDEIWVVLGSDADRIMGTVDLDGVGVVENPEWEEGIASSLRVGLDALTRLSRAERAVVMMGDQPEVSPVLVARLLESHVRSGRPVSIPKYRYTLGNPVVVDRSLWARVMSLEGDEGAMRLWRAHPEWVNEVWFSDHPPRDVDTETDVTDLRPRHPQ